MRKTIISRFSPFSNVMICIFYIVLKECAHFSFLEDNKYPCVISSSDLAISMKLGSGSLIPWIGNVYDKRVTRKGICLLYCNQPFLYIHAYITLQRKFRASAYSTTIDHHVSPASVSLLMAFNLRLTHTNFPVILISPQSQITLISKIILFYFSFIFLSWEIKLCQNINK